MENLVPQVFRPQVVTEEFLFSYGTILVSSKESCLANTTATAAGCGMGVRREELKGLVAFVLSSCFSLIKLKSASVA